MTRIVKPPSVAESTSASVRVSAPSPRIFLSPPHLEGHEIAFIEEAIAANWVGPVGPHLAAFEAEVAARASVAHAVAVNAGTAALHLILRGLGLAPGDEVLCQSFTFVASAAPITYLGARPVFIDSEATTWTIDPALVAETLAARARANRLPKAVIAVDLYGQCADYDALESTCARYDIPLVEDAAAAIGASYRGRPAGGFGRAGFFSFNGNKIITCSSGGMVLTNDRALAETARFLATQARDPAPHYEHSMLGHNYRLSNLLAGLGRGQLRVLDARVNARRQVFQRYAAGLGDLPGLTFMPEAPYGRSTRWLTVALIDPALFGRDRAQVQGHLAAAGIEARPAWKPLHTQPVFAGCEHVGGAVAERLFAQGLCLPSGSNLTAVEQDEIIARLRACCLA